MFTGGVGRDWGAGEGGVKQAGRGLGLGVIYGLLERGVAQARVPGRYLEGVGHVCSGGN